MADGAVLDVPAGIHHLEPFQMLDALRRFGEGVVDGVLDAGLGRADQFDLLVGVLCSVASINPLISETVESMVDIMLKARALGKNILFDPFKVD